MLLVRAQQYWEPLGPDFGMLRSSLELTPCTVQGAIQSLRNCKSWANHMLGICPKTTVLYPNPIFLMLRGIIHSGILVPFELPHKALKD